MKEASHAKVCVQRCFWQREESVESLRLSGFGVFQTVVEGGVGEEGRQELDHLGFFGGSWPGSEFYFACDGERMEEGFEQGSNMLRISTFFFN